MKAKSLQDLQGIQQRLAQVRARQEAQEAERIEAERRAQAEKHLFSRAAGRVQPLDVPARVLLAREQPPPVPVQRQLDERRVLQEALSDEFDTSTLLDVDDAMSYRRPGVGTGHARVSHSACSAQRVHVSEVRRTRLRRWRAARCHAIRRSHRGVCNNDRRTHP
jgi:hypothetical protein